MACFRKFQTYFRNMACVFAGLSFIPYFSGNDLREAEPYEPHGGVVPEENF